MTCIVALKHEGAVWMGADSAGVGGYSMHLRKDPKIYRVGSMLLGFTSSFRMGQLLGYKLKMPDHDPRMAAEKWMATEFIDACRTCFKDGGWMRKDHDVEEGGFFLVAYQGRVFHVMSDLQVAETLDDYAATGCGVDLALGSLFSSAGQDPNERVLLSLRAAAHFSAGVAEPFLVEKL
jgi:ATP-dependent protease HslVU (ClpYQ) peptidase subunit